MKLSVESDALVIPSSNGSAIAGSPPFVSTRAFSSSKRHFSAWSPPGSRCPHFLNPHSPQHLADDHFDMLVVDADALQAVDFLDLVNPYLARAFSPRMVSIVRIRRAFHQWLASLDHIALMDREMLTLGDQVFTFFADFGSDFDFALTFSVLAE